MPRIFTAFAWMLTLSSSPLIASDVCLINDSDHVAFFTVVSGTDRFEKQLPPNSHEYVSLAETQNDQVIIVQSSVTPSKDNSLPKMEVVATKVLKAEEKITWNFCYVRASGKEGLRMDLLRFSCLDIVPLQYKDGWQEKHILVRDQLKQSLKTTTDAAPNSPVQLRNSMWFALDRVDIDLPPHSP